MLSSSVLLKRRYSFLVFNLFGNIEYIYFVLASYYEVLFKRDGLQKETFLSMSAACQYNRKLNLHST